MTLRMAMKTNKILMVHGQELTSKRPRFDSLFPKESSFKDRTGKVSATFLELAATRTQFLVTPFLKKMLTQLTGAVCVLPTLGVQLPQSPHRKSTTGLKKREDKASPGPATKHANTLLHHLDLL